MVFLWPIYQYHVQVEEKKKGKKEERMEEIC